MCVSVLWTLFTCPTNSEFTPVSLNSANIHNIQFSGITIRWFASNEIIHCLHVFVSKFIKKKLPFPSNWAVLIGGLIGENGNTSMATTGVKLGICSKKMESFLKTHQISVHTKNHLGWVDSLAGGGWKQLISLNFIIFCHYRAKIRPMWAKSESIVNSHLSSVDTKFELYCVNTFSDNSQKPHI